jgi:hypothetical protein
MAISNINKIEVTLLNYELVIGLIPDQKKKILITSYIDL